MKRLRRLIFNTLIALSLTLCVVTAVMWQRSYRHIDFIRVISNPTLMPMTSPAQISALKLMQKNGWDGFYYFRVKAIAFDDGISYWYGGNNSQLVTNRNVPPGKILWGTNGHFLAADMILLTDKRDFLGISYRRSYLGKAADIQRLGIPLWYFCLLTILLPAWYVLRRILTRRTRLAGYCTQCGYDLRASPNRCPECGTIPPKRKTS